jgi:hypothetical protein
MPPKKRKADTAASTAPTKKTQKIADVEFKNSFSSSPAPEPQKTKNLAVQLDEQFYANSSKCANVNMAIDD